MTNNIIERQNFEINQQTFSFELPHISKNNDTFKKSEKNIPVFRKFAYGLGGLPIQLTTNSISFFINIFLLEIPQLNPFYIFYVSMLTRIWDAITDPIVGALVSNSDTKWGSFKPYMLGSLPILCPSYFLVFYNVDIDSQIGKTLFYICALFLFQTGSTLYFIPYGSMCMVLTSEVTERDKLTAYRMAFEILGMLLGSSLFGGIISAFRDNVKTCEPTNITSFLIDEQAKGYMIASGVCILIMIVCVLITVFGSIQINECKYDHNLGFSFYKDILTFPPYLILMLTFSLTATGMMFVQSNMALYIIHVLKMPKIMPYGILVMMCFGILLVPFAQIMIVKFGKKSMYYSGIITAVPVFISLIFLPENPGYILFFSIMVYTSYPVMISFLLPWSMLPDCIDHFIVLYSIHCEAAFVSFFVFFQKFALGFSVGMTGFVLGLAKYDNKLCFQPKSVEYALRCLAGVGSILLFFCAIISLYFYPINEKNKSYLTKTVKSKDIHERQTLEPVMSEEFVEYKLQSPLY